MGMSFDLGNVKISFQCPECKFSNSVTLNQVQRGETIICSGCHNNIKLVDKDASTKRGIEDVNQSFADLDDTIKKFNRSQR
jgi:transcription elongation factor Elf1